MRKALSGGAYALLMVLLFMPFSSEAQDHSPYDNLPSPGDGPFFPEEEIAVSPRDGWGEIEIEEQKEEPLPVYAEILLWPVNRVLDFIDIVRLDVGVGTSYGGILRVTRQGSVGYRKIGPGSVRVGSFGRKPPFLLEREGEFGAGKQFQSSPDREVCPSEIGLGLDLFLAGYGGICLEGVVDFLGGIVFLDPDNDDIR